MKTSQQKASKDHILGVIVPNEIIAGKNVKEVVAEFLKDNDQASASMVLMPRDIMENAKSTNISGLNQENDQNIFLPKSDKTPLILHPATYTVVLVESAAGEIRVLAYERPPKMVNELGLSRKKSIGIGGHADFVDAIPSEGCYTPNYHLSIHKATLRELGEELIFDTKVKHEAFLIENVMRLLDLDDAVGCTHIGEVSVLHVMVDDFNTIPFAGMESDGNNMIGLVGLGSITTENGYENWSVQAVQSPDGHAGGVLISAALRAKALRAEEEFKLMHRTNAMYEQARPLQQFLNELPYSEQAFGLAPRQLQHFISTSLQSLVQTGQVSAIGVSVFDPFFNSGRYVMCSVEDNVNMVGPDKETNTMPDPVNDWAKFRSAMTVGAKLSVLVKTNDPEGVRLAFTNFFGQSPRGIDMLFLMDEATKVDKCLAVHYVAAAVNEEGSDLDLNFGESVDYTNVGSFRIVVREGHFAKAV